VEEEIADIERRVDDLLKNIAPPPKSGKAG
jgi:hypothetical protein